MLSSDVFVGTRPTDSARPFALAIVDYSGVRQRAANPPDDILLSIASLSIIPRCGNSKRFRRGSGGGAGFGVNDIDPSTIEIDDDTTPGGGVSPVRSATNKDVSDPSDGINDFVASFNTSDLKDAGLLVTGKGLFITGQLNDGTPILGGPDDVQIAGDPNSSCQ